MAKTNSNFKLSKTTKRRLANILDPHLRGSWKRAMIDAEYAAQQQPKRERKSREVTPDSE